MQVVILAGGKGTRLKTITKGLPKPLAKINGISILEHIINQCKKYDFLDIKILSSYKSETIEKSFGNGSDFGVKIDYIREDPPLGTGGALISALDNLDEKFLVLYGDTFFDVDLLRLFNFHLENKADATIFIHPNDHPHDSDIVEINKAFQVTKIHPYPHNTEWLPNLVNAAMYVLNKASLYSYSVSKEKFDIAKNLFPKLILDNKKIMGYLSAEYIKDAGTPERLKKVESDILSNKVNSLNFNHPKKTIFLDRDGVINVEVNHLSKIDDFSLIEGVAESLIKARNAGYIIVVVTNQPVIARGELTEEGLKLIHNKMDSLLGKKGAYIDRLYYCPHHPDKGFLGEVESLKVECNCRKPKTGMLEQAKKDLNIDLERSWLVGDSMRDIQAADKLGVRSVFINSCKENFYETKNTSSYYRDSLYSAIEFIISMEK